MFDLSNDLMCVSLTDGTFVEINMVMVRELGYDKDYIVNRKFHEFIHPDDVKSTLDVQKDMAVGSTANNFEVRYRRKDATYVRLSWNGHQVGNRYYAVGRVIEKVDEFLSKVTHELRTPLNSIIGFADLLELSDTLSDDDRENLCYIQKSSGTLLELINNTLDINKISSENVIIEPIDIDRIIVTTCQAATPALKAKHIELTYNSKNMNNLVSGEARKMAQIFRNLIDNAIKYNNDHGSITIDAVVVDNKLSISVADTGLGIKDDYLDFIFVPFERCGIGHEIQGTGLGLTLTKKLVELFDGTISYHTEYGNGSTFTLTFPIHSVSTRNVSLYNEMVFNRQHNSHTILYVEDNNQNMELVRKIVSTIPELHFLSAIDGQSGYNAVLKHQPNIILLDYHLPDFNADILYAKLKKHGIMNYNVDFICILSADAGTHQMDTMRSLGIDNYLIKPLNVREFKKKLTDIMGN